MSKLPPLTPRSTIRLNKKARSTTAKNGNGLTLRTVALEDPESIAQQANLGSFRSSTSKHKEHCMKLLMSGYADAYVEFFEIADADEDQQDIRNNDQLMVVLGGNLSACEDSVEKGDLLSAYKQRQHLADLCLQQGALTNAIHHAQKAQEVAEAAQSESLMADAYLRLGNLCTQSNLYVKAAAAYEDRLSLVKGATNIADRATLEKETHTLLARALHVVATKKLLGEDARFSDEIVLIDRAADSSQQGGDSKLHLDILLDCAKLREARGMAAEAIKFYTKYLGKRKEMKGVPDGTGQAEACLGLAHCHEKEGDADIAIQYLEQLVTLSEKTGQLKIACDTCSTLGNLLAEKGNFADSSGYFAKAMDLAKELDDGGLLGEIQVKAGIAKATGVHKSILKRLATNTKQDFMELLDWSLARKEFSSSASS